MHSSVSYILNLLFFTFSKVFSSYRTLFLSCCCICSLPTLLRGYHCWERISTFWSFSIAFFMLLTLEKKCLGLLGNCQKVISCSVQRRNSPYAVCLWPRPQMWVTAPCASGEPRRSFSPSSLGQTPAFSVLLWSLGLAHIHTALLTAISVCRSLFPLNITLASDTASLLVYP